VSETGVKLEAAMPSNQTAVRPVRSVPVNVTFVPPAAGPLVGEMLVTVGGNPKFKVTGFPHSLRSGRRVES